MLVFAAYLITSKAISYVWMFDRTAAVKHSPFGHLIPDAKNS